MPSETEDQHQRRPSLTTTTRVQQSMGHPAPVLTEPLHCPRCDSTNTKFCYYNNYNLAQPRHFCKGCRRYWTQGGTLRDVPVGGGSRKNAFKRSRSSGSSSSCSPSSSLTQEVNSVSSAAAPAAAKPAEVVKVETELDHGHHPLMDLNENVAVGNGGGGGFTSLLNSHQVGQPHSGFLALGGHGYGYGPGLGNGFDDVAVGGVFGYGSRGVLAFPDVGDFASHTVNNNNNSGSVSGASTACNTWQMMTGADAGLVDGDCFAWPELEISMMPAAAKGFK